MQYDIICGKCGEGYGMFDYHECKTVGAVKSNGGPSSYYDLDPEWTTWNDLLEDKSKSQWGALAIHMKDIGKAFMRFGSKEGTSNSYDARKIIYSGLRLLGMIEGKDAMRRELLALLEDDQFKEETKR